MKSFIPLLLCMGALTGTAGAQSHGMPDFGLRLTPSRSETNLQVMRIERYAVEYREKACKTSGCLYIVNRTQDYDAVALHFDTVLPGTAREPIWSGNVFDRSLTPSKTFIIVKVGDQTTCNLPVQVIIRHRRTREEIVIPGKMSLCENSGINVIGIEIVKDGK